MRSTAKISKLIIDLLDREGVVLDMAKEKIRKLGGKAVPALIAALADPAFEHRHDGVHSLQDSPMEAVLDLLAAAAAEEAVGPMASLLSHSREHIRKYAALSLGETGLLSALEHIPKALVDSEPYVRSFAVMGVERGARRKHATARFQSRAFDLLLPSMDDTECNGAAHHAPESLMSIDPRRGRDVLLSEKYFTAAYEEIWRVLQALNAHAAKIPAERLEALAVELRARADTRCSFDFAYGEVLRAMARLKHPAASARIRDAIQTGSDDVRSDAIRILSEFRMPGAKELLTDVCSSPKLKVRIEASRALKKLTGKSSRHRPSEEDRVIDYLYDEGFLGDDSILSEVGRFKGVDRGKQAVVYAFNSGDRRYYAVTEPFLNAFPAWGLTPREAYQVHVGLSLEPSPCADVRKQQLAPRIKKMLAAAELESATNELCGIWELRLDEGPSRKPRVMTVIRSSANEKMIVLVEGLEPSIYDERIDAGEPVPAYVYVRLFLGELAVDED